MLEQLLNPEILITLFTLTALEIVLGIDNIVLIVVVVGRLPEQSRDLARKLGLAGAMITRILLLLSISWLTKLTTPLFTLPLLNHPMSGKDLVLLIGGLFLLGKATTEIHEKTSGPRNEMGLAKAAGSLASAAVQITLLDIVFSLDSVITAVGMARELWVMVLAVVLAVIVMLVFSGPVTRFVHRHPSLQILAFSFLLLVGVFLVAEAVGKHIDRGYIYFAMFFSLLVEFFNIRMRRTQS